MLPDTAGVDPNAGAGLGASQKLALISVGHWDGGMAKDGNSAVRHHCREAGNANCGQLVLVSWVRGVLDKVGLVVRSAEARPES